MVEKKTFVLYTSYKDMLDLLTDEQRGKLMKALFIYCTAGEIPPGYFEQPEELAFMAFKAVIDRDTDKWLKRRENARQRNV